MEHGEAASNGVYASCIGLKFGDFLVSATPSWNLTEVSRNWKSNMAV